MTLKRPQYTHSQNLSKSLCSHLSNALLHLRDSSKRWTTSTTAYAQCVTCQSSSSALLSTSSVWFSTAPHPKTGLTVGSTSFSITDDPATRQEQGSRTRSYTHSAKPRRRHYSAIQLGSDRQIHDNSPGGRLTVFRFSARGFDTGPFLHHPVTESRYQYTRSFSKAISTTESIDIDNITWWLLRR